MKLALPDMIHAIGLDDYIPQEWVDRIVKAEREVADRWYAVRVFLDDQPITDDPFDDPFLQWELILFALFGSTYDDRVKTALELLDEQVITPNSVNRLDPVLGQLPGVFNRLITPDIAMRTEDILERAMRAGAELAGGYALIERSNVRRNVIEGMVKSAKWYGDNYFNNQVMPGIYSAVNDLVSGTFNTITPETFDNIRSMIVQRMDTPSYWRLTANQAASRAYHYGVVKAAQAARYQAYEYVAVLDAHTSDICKELNGTRFPIIDAVNYVERVANADTGDIKSIAPWHNLSDVQGRTQQQLSAVGALMPPQHANCRSTIRLLSY